MHRDILGNLCPLPSLSGIKTPLIIISASDDWQTRERARELGAVAFFRKPVDDQALLNAIAWAVSGARKK
ncbi:response regulator [bacterium]|nr:response regulator [bacterium]